MPSPPHRSNFSLSSSFAYKPNFCDVMWVRVVWTMASNKLIGVFCVYPKLPCGLGMVKAKKQKFEFLCHKTSMDVKATKKLAQCSSISTFKTIKFIRFFLSLNLIFYSCHDGNECTFDVEGFYRWLQRKLLFKIGYFETLRKAFEIY